MEAIVLNEAQLYQFIGQYIWPFLRIGALFMAMPIIGSRTVNAKTRLLLALMTTAIIAPTLHSIPSVELLSLAGVVVIVQEVVVGLALGFLFQVVMHVFVLSGQFIAMKMGLGFASMNDPTNGVSVTIISQFYLLLTTILFLVMNGHLMVIEIIAESFTSIPIGEGGLGVAEFMLIVSMGSWLFSAALVIVMPVFTGLLVINMAFGTMNRSAPQINVFTVGFPTTLIFGLLFMWLSLAVFLPHFNLVFDQAFMYAHTLLRIP